MSLDAKNYRNSETIQNWIAFGLIVIGIVLALSELGWSLFVTSAGVIMGLVFILRRVLLRKEKRLGVLTVMSILCCVYIPLSYLLLWMIPHFYGDDLQGLSVWGITVAVASLGAVVFTSIELFRTTKK